MRHRGTAATHISLTVVIATAILAGGAPAASAAWRSADALGPKPARCGVGCWGKAGDVLAVSWLADFTVSPHILRVGQVMHGKAKEFAGQHVNGWSWPAPFHCRPNAPTCRARLTAPTHGWAIATMSWANNIGRAITQDAYAVVGKHDAILQGYVRDRAGDGVGGITLHMSRRHSSYRRKTVTGGDGYFSARLKPGSYLVRPVSRSHHKDRFKPGKVTKRLRRGHNTRADFTLLVGLKVTLRATTTAIPADGSSRAIVVAHAERDGKPVKGVAMKIWAGGSPAQPDSPARTPGLMCLANGSRLWPDGHRFEVGNATHRKATTDDKGDVAFYVIAGTKPGALEVIAWALDSRGDLRTRDLSDVSDDLAIGLAAVGGGGLGQFRSNLQTYAASNHPSFSSSATAVAAQLAAIGRQPGTGLGGLAYSPIRRQGNSEQAVLVTASEPAPSPPSLVDSGRVGGSPSLVVPIQKLSLAIRSAYGGFSGATAAGQLPPFPTLAEWEAGSKPGWELQPGLATSGAPLASWTWFGWPYPAKGVCG